MMTNYRGEPFKSIRSAVEAHLDGCEIHQGQVEDAARTASNNSLCLSNLIQLLVDKGVISEEDVETSVLRGLFS